jgi:hypothetical protein
MKKILFLHGLGSSGATQTAEYLRKKLPEVEVISPDIPLHPHKAMRFLNMLCYDLRPDVIIGTSMGAMFAQQMHGFKKILVNPAFHVSQIMLNDLGVKYFTNPRADGETKYTITPALSDRYKEIEEDQFGGITEFDVKHTHAFFGTEDTLVNGYDEYLQYYTNATKYPGGHALLHKWVKAYVLPCAHQLLAEETDNKELDAVKTYQMLADISGGGGLGRAALLNLENALIKILSNVATNYYEKLYDVRDVATDGFQKITREFVFDIEEIPNRNYTNFLYKGLQDYFQDEVKEKQFLIWAVAGRHLDPIDAMTRLAYMYLDHCGVSLGVRTIAYDAASEWLHLYNDMHPDELKWDEDAPFCEVIPYLIEDCDKDLLEKYDITYMEVESEIDLALEMVGLYDEDTMKALFWGLDRQFKSEKELFFYVLMKVLVEADKSLDTTERAIYFEQANAESAMLDWTLNNREHLLCYIIRVVPRCDVFIDEMVKAVGLSDPFIDALRFNEFVYMPSGFQRKQHFNVGDNVQYIFYDGKTATLRTSNIEELTNNDRGILMSDGYIVPERYVFPL